MTALRRTPTPADAALAARRLSAAPMPGPEEPLLRPERDESTEAGASTPTLVAFIVGALIPQLAILLLWAIAG